MLFNLSRSLSLCFQKKANSELFFPTQNNILQPNIISIDSTGEKRETRKSLLSCVIKEIKILCAQTNKKQTNKKKIFRFWMGVKKAESALLNFFVCVACRSSSLVRLFRVLLFSIIMLLKLHLFHSSLSLSLSIHSSLFISRSFVLFSSLFLFFSLLRFSWRVLTRRERRRKQSARAKLFLSLSLSLVKNKKLQSVLHRGDGFGVQSFDFL